MAKSPEQRRVDHENILTDVCLWLAMVNLQVEDAVPDNLDDKSPLTLAQEYLRNPMASLIISLAPHTGHTDAVMVRKLIRELFPDIQARLLFIAAQDTWDTEKGNSSLKLRLAESIIGKFHQFDRSTSKSSSKEAKELAQKLSSENPPVMVMFPQGTRKIGAPVGTSLVAIAHDAKRPILVINISPEAAAVLPKLEGKKEAILFIIRRMVRRIRYLATNQHNFNVTLTAADFIESQPVKRDMRRQFLAAHHADASGYIHPAIPSPDPE